MRKLAFTRVDATFCERKKSNYIHENSDDHLKVCHKQFSTSPLHSSYYSERETKDLNEIAQCSLRTYKQEQTAFNFPFLKETFPE